MRGAAVENFENTASPGLKGSHGSNEPGPCQRKKDLRGFPLWVIPLPHWHPLRQSPVAQLPKEAGNYRTDVGVYRLGKYSANPEH